MDYKYNLQELLGQGYNDGFFTNCSDRYRVFAGARNTKKSWDIGGIEPLMKIISDPRRNVIMVRQNDSDNRLSTFANLEGMIDTLHLNDYFSVVKAPTLLITYKPTGQVIVFRGMNNPSGLTSITAPHGKFTDIYFEEASELRSLEDFRTVDGSFRDKSLPMQLTFTLNPWKKDFWIYDAFFKGRMEDDPHYMETHTHMEYEDPDFDMGYGKGLFLHKSSYLINEFRNPGYDESARRLKEKAPKLYDVEMLGCWGVSSDATYPEWSEKLTISPEEAKSLHYAAFAIGVDTGYSDGEGHIVKGKVKAATTAQLVGITEDWQNVVCLKEWFYTAQGDPHPKRIDAIYAEMADAIYGWEREYANVPVLMKGDIPVFVDSADIGARQILEMQARMHVPPMFELRIGGSTKMPIAWRVSFERYLMALGHIRVSTECYNLLREIRNSLVGGSANGRADGDDHAENANEYAWAPFAKQLRDWLGFKPH